MLAGVRDCGDACFRESDIVYVNSFSADAMEEGLPQFQVCRDSVIDMDWAIVWASSQQVTEAIEKVSTLWNYIASVI